MKHLRKHLIITIEKASPELRALIMDSRFMRQYDGYNLNDEDSPDFHFILPSEMEIDTLSSIMKKDFNVIEFSVSAILPDKIYTSIDGTTHPHTRYLEDAADHLEAQAQTFIQKRKKSPEQFLDKMLERIILYAIKTLG